MTIQPPVIDARDQATRLAKLRRLLPAYVPELAPANGAAAAGLMAVFARHTGALAVALNRLPQRQQLAFLDVLGLHLLPAQAARVPLVFTLLETSARDVNVPAGSQAAAVLPPPPPAADDVDAPPAANEPLIFATERAITVTRARLAALYSIDPGTDTFTDHSRNLATGFTAFGDDDLTEHAIYFGHDHLFALAGDITVLLLVTLDNAPDRALALTWEYFADAGWLPLTRDELEDTTLGLTVSGQVALRRVCGPNAKQDTIAGHKSFWIRGRLATPLTPSGIRTTLPVINDVRARLNFEKRCLAPEAAFADGASLDTTKDFLPFGAQPKRFSTFYIASKEVFQRTGAKVGLDFALSINGLAGGSKKDNAGNTVAAGTITLTWEYCDGTSWAKLGVEPTEGSPTAYVFDRDEHVAFTCPPDWAETQVNGKKNYWMRVRIVSGDFGHPVQVTIAADGTSTLDPANIAPPVVKTLAIGYSYATDAQTLDHCLAFNDFVYSDHTDACQWPDQTFKPFRAVADQVPTIHFGFDRPLPTGLVSLYADVTPNEQTDDDASDGGAGARYVWEYASPRGWTQFGVLDDTDGLRRSGTIQFIGSPDAERRDGLGGALYRVRARLKQGEVTTASAVNGIWLNGVWARHHTIADRELLGTSDGNSNQTFQTQRTPLLDGEVVEVQEWIGRGESWRLWFDGVSERDIRLERDAVTGETLAVWVHWALRPHLYASEPDARHYTLERATGTVRFGDGINGMMPPAGRRVVISYASGGGVRGNVAPGTVSEIRAAIPYLKSVFNPIAAGGGSDVETSSDIAERGAQHVRHRDRAVSPLDIEWLAREASPAVARARCLPLTGPSGRAQRGWITVIVVPVGLEAAPIASPQLRRDVQSFLSKRVPAAIASHIRVADAPFTRVAVRADVVPVDAGAAAALNDAIHRALDGFLHPLTGGVNGRGWDFGETVHLSQIASLLENTPGVDHVNDVSLVSDGALLGDVVPIERDALITFGDHEIRLSLGDA